MMHRRVLAMALPLLPVELVRSEADAPDACLAVLDAARHPSLTSLDRAAATLRLDAVSPAAWHAGVRPGQTLASATAKLASLELRLLPAGALEAALHRLCEAFLALSPQVAPCMHLHGAVVLVDAQGLLERNASEREASLAAAMLSMAASLGHHGRVAVADGPWAAAALARHGKAAGFFRQSQVFHAPMRDAAPLLARLPLAALDLGEAHEGWLAGLGLRTLGDLAQAPRKELTVRLGAEAKRVLSRLSDVDSDPLPSFALPEDPLEAQHFDDECTQLEPLLFALRGLTAKLAARLFGRGMATRRLRVGFVGAGGVRESVAVELPAPLHRAGELFAVLKARLESYRLTAPVRSLELLAELLAPRDDRSGHLYQAFDRGEAALPRVLGELLAHHGSERVGFLQVCEAWRPDDRSRLLPPEARPRSTHEARVPESYPLVQPFEPLRVFPRAVPIEPLEVVAPYMHLEGAEWWRYGDDALVLDAAKGGEGAVALVERVAPSAAMDSEKPSLMRLWGWFG